MQSQTSQANGSPEYPNCSAGLLDRAQGSVQLYIEFWCWTNRIKLCISILPCVSEWLMLVKNQRCDTAKWIFDSIFPAAKAVKNHIPCNLCCNQTRSFWILCSSGCYLYFPLIVRIVVQSEAEHQWSCACFYDLGVCQRQGWLLRMFPLPAVVWRLL